MSAVMTKTCLNCGRSFLTRDKNKDFCDIKCEEDHRDGIVVKPRANEFIADTKVCKNCGKTFRRRYYEGLEVFEKRKKRLCNKASKETREVMKLIRDTIGEIDSSLALRLVPDCVYRGGQCHELSCCGEAVA